MPGWWLVSGDQRRLTGSGSALEAFTYFSFTADSSVNVYSSVWSVWLSRNVLVRISIVTLHHPRLVLEWMDDYFRVGK